MIIKEIVFIFLILTIELVFCNTMLYKRNNHDKLEPDLIPVSSTVIPLSVYEVSYGLDGNNKPNDEYKIEKYLKKLRKKVKHKEEYEDPDTLITLKKLKHEKKENKKE